MTDDLNAPDSILDAIKERAEELEMPISLTLMSLAAAIVPDFDKFHTDATVWDYIDAVDHLISDLNKQVDDIPSPTDSIERPATDDDRPLYKRLAAYPRANEAAQNAQVNLDLCGILLAAKLGTEDDLAVRYQDALEAFYDRLGLPKDRSEDPDLHENILDTLVAMIDKHEEASASDYVFHGGVN